MPQQQRQIPLTLITGEPGSAVATGNNASCLCSCERDLPLIGKSGQIKGPSENTSVLCPDCQTRFFVEPDGGDYKQAVRVIEL
jgi:hypothetical protein